eukprot:TRINITY_DN35715_c0_g1_i1.p1 TRINITY_DN35715_c0_g1~~TRINITY_DN35715_c0_g1_i1.p1  ORF type:complete len:679 (-),score=148.34 TRINITY_DN35715_c0_g1_i1:95-2080(-)
MSLQASDQEEASLRERAGAAATQDDWRKAAELYSAAIAASRSRLSSGVKGGAQNAVASMSLSLSGRGKALLEMGRARGKLPGNAEVLKAALADGKAAIALAKRPGLDISCFTKAVRTLSEVLSETGGSLDEVNSMVQEALDSARKRGDKKELQALQEFVSDSDKRALAAEMDAAADDGRSPGTFRWPPGMGMPELPSKTKPSLASVMQKGWGPYLKQRGGDELIATAQSNARMLDGLSFPLSLAYVLCKSDAVKWAEKSPESELHIVCLGATSKAEVRILEETKYWLELNSLLADRCQVRLHFVGPEIDKIAGNPDVHGIAPPCAKTFFQGRKDLTSENTVCAIFNGGFGNFVASPEGTALNRDDLLWSWLPDLAFLAEAEYFCAFFCANDFADLRGEVAIHSSLLGSRFVLGPQRNPFSMATVYSGEQGTKGAEEWFSGNSFMYATCGFEKGDQHPRLKDSESSGKELKAARQSMLKAVFQSARSQLSSGSSSPSFEVSAGTPPLIRPTKTTATFDQRIPTAAKSSAGYVTDTSAPKVSLSMSTGISVSASAPAAVIEDTPKSSLSASSDLGACAIKPEVSMHFTEADADGCRGIRFEMLLPAAGSVEDLDLQISDTQVSLMTSKGVRITETWLEKIDSAKARASFSSKKGRLVVKAPLS